MVLGLYYKVSAAGGGVGGLSGWLRTYLEVLQVFDAQLDGLFPPSQGVQTLEREIEKRREGRRVMLSCRNIFVLQC